MKKLYIIIPSLEISGPTNGAIALLKLLRNSIDTTIVFLKNTPAKKHEVKNLSILDLSKEKNLRSKIKKFNNIILENSQKYKVSSISMCFSADLFSLLSKKIDLKINSIRGNLYKNYSYDYGLLGYFLAIFHLFLCNFFDRSIVMNKKMLNQVKKLSFSKVSIIKNFIDENLLVKYRKKDFEKKIYKLIYVGSLTKRKNISSIIKLVHNLKKYKRNIFLDILGEGNDEKKIKELINDCNLNSIIKLHGFKKNPYTLLSSSSIMILPSFSEGLSRASMEALFLGIPVVIRNVDSNNELIENGLNGYLFDDDSEMLKATLKTIELIEDHWKFKKNNLLPKSFYLKSAKDKYENLFNL